MASRIHTDDSWKRPFSKSAAEAGERVEPGTRGTSYDDASQSTSESDVHESAMMPDRRCNWVAGAGTVAQLRTKVTSGLWNTGTA
jgi:hypothetical protein